MQTINNPVLDSYQKQIDASRHIATVVFDGTDRMEHLMLDTTRKAFDERMKFYQALAAVRDPQGFAALQSAFFSHTPEKMLKVQQELMEIFTHTQKEISQTMRQFTAEVNFNDTHGSMEKNLDTSPQANHTLTGIFSMWDKAVKDTVAMATGTAAAIFPTPQGDSEEAEKKPAARKRARAK
jgi:phasin family protein